MNATSLFRNVFTSRAAWLRKMLETTGRDIAKECGHPDTISIADYHAMYRRGDVARRIVTLLPDESWSGYPEIYETENEGATAFEKAWESLYQKMPIYPYLHRADILSGIGRYGVLLLGFDDGGNLDQPVPGISDRGESDEDAAVPKERKLVYLRPLTENVARVASLETDATNPRFGQPKAYTINFVDDEESTSGEITPSPIITGTQAVHWSRILHLADNRMNSEIYGTPRMQVVYNRLLDIKKIAGGSGEMFWKGGFPGISLESHPGVDEEVTFDKEATAAEMESYMNGLQRYISTVGMTAKSLMVQVADPLPHLDLQLRLIATALGVPMRVLLGSERGELASSQDAIHWNRQVNCRRVEYLDAFVLRPFVDRLIAVGVLPKPQEDGYEIAWKDLNSPSDETRAKVAENQSNAMAKYVQSGADQIMPPYHYFTMVMGMEPEEAKAIVKAAETQIEEDSRLLEPIAPVLPGAPGAFGKPAASKGAAPAAKPAPGQPAK